MKRIWVFYSLLLFLPLTGLGQYHLQEFGFRMGGGTNVGLPFTEDHGLAGQAGEESAYGLSWAYNAQLFYSHYFCGKAVGYHLELGARGFAQPESRSQTAGLLSANASVIDAGARVVAPAYEATHQLHYLTLGAMFKFRTKNYHRPIETAYHIGPVLNVNLVASTVVEGGNREPLRDFDALDVNAIGVGLHASLWHRRKLGKQGSWFFVPGVEFYPAQNLNNANGASLASLYPFLNMAFTLWNNR